MVLDCANRQNLTLQSTNSTSRKGRRDISKTSEEGYNMLISLRAQVLLLAFGFNTILRRMCHCHNLLLLVLLGIMLFGVLHRLCSRLYDR